MRTLHHRDVAVITARTIPDAWFQTLKVIWDHGLHYNIAKGGSYEGQVRKELPGVVIVHMSHPHEYPRVEPGGPVTQEYVEEYAWDYVLPSTHRKKRPNETYTYAERIGSQVDGIVQKHVQAIKDHRKATNNDYYSDACIDLPEMDPEMDWDKYCFSTNQAAITVAQPTDIDLSDPPCVREILTRLRTNDLKLNMTIVMRSWDCYSAFQANLGAFYMLQEYLTLLVGNRANVYAKTGTLTAISTGAHIYDMYFPMVAQRLNEVL